MISVQSEHSVPLIVTAYVWLNRRKSGHSDSQDLKEIPEPDILRLRDNKIQRRRRVSKVHNSRRTDTKEYD